MALATALTLTLAQNGGHPLEAQDAAELEYSAYRAMWEQTCFGLSHREAERTFNKRFGNRIQALKTGFAARFSKEELRAAHMKWFGPEFIHVGGCLSDGSQSKMISFKKLLKRLEATMHATGE